MMFQMIPLALKQVRPDTSAPTKAAQNEFCRAMINLSVKEKKLSPDSSHCKDFVCEQLEENSCSVQPGACPEDIYASAIHYPSSAALVCFIGLGGRACSSLSAAKNVTSITLLLVTLV